MQHKTEREYMSFEITRSQTVLAVNSFIKSNSKRLDSIGDYDEGIIVLYYANANGGCVHIDRDIWEAVLSIAGNDAQYFDIIGYKPQRTEAK